MKEYFIHNVKLCYEDRVELSDLWIKDGLIYAIGDELGFPSDVESMDGEGNYLLPGFIDIHTHLSDTVAGCHLADTYTSGTKIALINGITTLYSFITQGDNQKLSDAVSTTRKKAVDKIFCNVGWHLTPTGYDEENLRELVDLLKRDFSTLKLYTTYKDAELYSSYEEIHTLAALLKQHDVTILVHCEDENVLNKYSKMKADYKNPFTITSMRPAEAEYKAVEEIIEIARETDAKFHIVHVSSPESVDRITGAKDELNITCETAPHYLLLDENVLKGEEGYHFLCTPPLRDEKSRIALYEKAINGEIDLFAADHCAFSWEDKYKFRDDIRIVPKGLAGIGALVPTIYEISNYMGDSGLSFLAKHLSAEPAKVVGKYPRKGAIQIGSDADLVLLKKSKKKRQLKPSLNDTFNVYEGFETKLDICAVFLNGELVVKDNEIINPQDPKGKLI